MLFDIHERRRGMVRFVYAGLAVIFLVGFVGFGVGSNFGGGLFGGGGHGGGGGGHGGGGRSVDDQLGALLERVDSQPRDARAWRRISLLEAGAAFERSSGGHGGGGERLAKDGRRHLAESVAAYEAYAELVGSRRISRALAQTAARSYALLGIASDAVDAQRIAARGGGAGAYFALAQYAASAGDSELTNRAVAQALRRAPAAQRGSLRVQVAQLRRLAAAGPRPPGSPAGGQAGGAPPGGHASGATPAPAG